MIRSMQPSVPQTITVVPRGRRMAVVPVAVERRIPADFVAWRLLGGPAVGAGLADRRTTRRPAQARRRARRTPCQRPRRPADASDGSSGPTEIGCLPADAGTWIGWNAAGSMMLAGLGLREPAMPGSATRASAAVSAAIASTRLRRTIRARYANSVAARSLPVPRVAPRIAAVSERAGRLPVRSRPGRTPRPSRRGSGPGSSCQ